MKKGWQTKTLGEVLERTETVNPLLSPNAEFEYIDVSSVSNTAFEIQETQRLKGKDAPSRARKLVRTNDIIFATIRPTLQRIAIVPDHLDKQVCSTGYFVLRPKQGIDHRFVFYSLFTENFIWQMESLQKGASYPAVTDGDVRAQKIPVPPLGEQQRIVGLLDEAFEGLATAKANAEKNLQNARALWSAPDTRAKLLAGLAEKGFGHEQLAEMQNCIDAGKSDIFDVLAYIRYNTPTITREARAGQARVSIHSTFNAKQQAFLDFVLSHYVAVGVEELEQQKLTPLLRLKYGAIQDAVADLGQPDEIGRVFAAFQKYLYTEKAA